VTHDFAKRAVTASWGAAANAFCVLVHGGTGARSPAELGDDRQGCKVAAEAAAAILRAGGSALDAVQRAVEVLEDDPRFNAATGGALTVDGRLELDAAIMDGRDLRAGAVCCLPPYRHPIAVARAVLEEGRHLLYAGTGADAFARRCGFAPVLDGSMITADARGQLARIATKPTANESGGTVGAVARDRQGHVAAATSTGGIMGKQHGRVGDSPILGAGTYADDLSGAASATGYGEGILRMALGARATQALLAGHAPKDAASAAMTQLRARVGTEAGLILVAPDGRLGWARSSPDMPWAAVWDDQHEDGG
jgi:L-asparaginase / beta-aspartyl-peptidase